MPVFQLTNEIIFPPPELAEPDGLLAVGGDLSPARLLAAYQQGLFPWYSGKEPILWWSLSPRLVLFPEEFHLSKSLARTIRRQVYQVSADTAFAEVIAACAAVRQETGTWITQEMQAAYIHLYELGFAHSIECRFEGELVGGLYGVCLDKMFFGESMFSLRDDASKVALAALVNHAKQLGIQAIDCQMTTAHMLRFGSHELDRPIFQELLDQSIQCVQSQPRWQLA
ncbi:MAG: leucyl/phenylalanyl-tRNA--protein transferase [Candidatus Electronema aureum]|uniref:Leucyl/phenylalanyl-tRNA--protein transferase n=1 Tax=Candidatus Electronema aureum TaxID=2005002 RepID=A0A521G2M2_9BACT|nr:MAG: leucyl/phenylalanyl-tRNA--protein transferase [Candidatus Electronema aureum]